MRKQTITAIIVMMTFLAFSIVLLPVDDSDAAEKETWDGTVDTSWYNTDSNTFSIGNAKQLAGLAILVNNGNAFQGKTINLANSIDLNNKDWTPIGKSDAPFKGTFAGSTDAQILNLKIESDTDSYLGLFGLIDTPATIKDVNIVNADVVGVSCIGSLIGSAHTGTIESCHISGTINISGHYKVGGLTGEGYAKISGCTVKGDDNSKVVGTYKESDLEGDNVGGLVGFRGEGEIVTEECSVENVSVEGTRKVGGLIGSAFGDNTTTGCKVACVNVNSNATAEYIKDNAKSIAIGGMIGLFTSNGNNDGKLESCTVSNISLSSDNPGVTMSYLVGGQRGDATVIPAPGGDWSQSNNTIGEGNTGSNSMWVMKNGSSYPTIDAALEGESSAVTLSIAAGTYDMFSIANTDVPVTIQPVNGAKVTFIVDKTNPSQINAENLTLSGLNFISENGAYIISSGECDNLIIDGCTFTGDGTGTALYIHQPNITVENSTFKDFERGYYTCGDNHAAGIITFKGNTFEDVRVPFDGYWGKEATKSTNITITGNTITTGDKWNTSYIQLWDYSQYFKWIGNTDSDRQDSALKASVGNNTYNGDVVIYATHFDWMFATNDVSFDSESQERLVYRNLIIVSGKTTVTNADGSPITSFNDQSESEERNGHNVIYSLSEGRYIFTTNGTDGDISYEFEVTKPVVGKTQEATNYLAEVGDDKFTDIKSAIDKAMKPGSDRTVTLLADVTVDPWDQIWNISGITFDGNDHKIIIKSIESGGNHDAVFHSAGNNVFKNLTIDLTGLSASKGRAFNAAPDDEFSNVNIVGNGTLPYGIVIGGTDAAGDAVKVSGCTFVGIKHGVYDSETGAVENLSISDSKFSGCEYAVILRSVNGEFTGNTVIGGKLNVMKPTQTIEDNYFDGTSRIKFYTGGAEFHMNRISTMSYMDFDDSLTDAVDVSGNYWGGGKPTDEQLGGKPSKVICDDYYYDEDLTQNSEDSVLPPIIDDDDDELPFIPGQNQSSKSDDTTTLVAIVAGAAVVAIIAVMIVGIYRGRL